MGGGGGHDDQPGGSGDPATPRPAATGTACIDDLRLIKELADRLGRGRYFSADPREVFDELRLRQRRWHRRLRRHQLSSGSTRSRVSSGPAQAKIIPARRGCSPTAFRPPTAGPASSGSSTTNPTRRPDVNYPYVLTTGRLMAQYQSGTQTRRVPSPSQAQVPARGAAAPRPRPSPEHRQRRHRPAQHSPRRSQFPRHDHH